MGKDKLTQPNQAQTKMNQFTKPGTGPKGTGIMDSPGGSSNAPTGTDAILNAKKGSSDAVQWKIEEVKVDVSLLRHALCKVDDRVTEAETRISTAEDEITTLKSQVTQLLRSTVILKNRAEDSKTRSCMNNLRLVGVPEGVDTPDMALMMEEWFVSWSTPGTLSKNFPVERAHRSLVVRPPQGAPPLTNHRSHPDRRASCRERV